MGTVSNFDRELIFKLQRLARDTHGLQLGLHTAGHGCGCDTTSLCAWHSETFNRLSEVERMIHIEINHLTRGE